MDVCDSSLPRWLQGADTGQAPLRPAGAPLSVAAKPLLLATPAAPERARAWPISAALLLFVLALLTIAARGLVPEAGLTVELPPATPAPVVVDAAGSASRLSSDQAAAVRASLEADLAAASYDGPRPAGIALPGATPADHERAVTCLTQAIYYEAGTEPEAGMRAVAQVVINRVRHPDYPNTICGVVYQGAMRPGGGCQFTFTCDGALARRPMAGLWARAERYAREALAGRAFGDVGYATHYHTFEVWPNWGRRLTMTNMIGRHLFHRLPGAGGAPAAFYVRYAGHEPVPGGWRPDAPGADPLDADVLTAQQIAELSADRLPPAPTIRTAPAIASGDLPDSRMRQDALPESQVRPEFRDSGRWIGG